VPGVSDIHACGDGAAAGQASARQATASLRDGGTPRRFQPLGRPRVSAQWPRQREWWNRGGQHGEPADGAVAADNVPVAPIPLPSGSRLEDRLSNVIRLPGPSHASA
jgi:hypothetical protein